MNSEIYAGNDLVRIVRINEDIKRIVRMASKINILALNAILVSRRAGSVALGFGVISDELRGFSKELTGIMVELTGLSYAAVQMVSSYQRYHRINRLLLLARDNIGVEAIVTPLSNSNARVAALQVNLAESYRGLQKLVCDADEGSRFGSVISRSLKIEATYGGSFTQLLAQIALEFSEYIDAIPALLNQLKNHIQE